MPIAYIKDCVGITNSLDNGFGRNYKHARECNCLELRITKKPDNGLPRNYKKPLETMSLELQINPTINFVGITNSKQHRFPMTYKYVNKMIS